jgi:FixJ family two-component response regulator
VKSRGTGPEALVYVIDDDRGVCKGLSSLLRTTGIEVLTFESPQAFCVERVPEIPACLILDVRLRGASGFALQQEIVNADAHLPIVFLTAYGDVPMTVRAMKAGAHDFLTKPFRDQEILESVAGALQTSRDLLRVRKQTDAIRRRYTDLSSREQSVLLLVADGLRNKQIGERLNLSEVTVKTHRSTAMRKLGVSSVADLMKILMTLFPSVADLLLRDGD